MVRLALAVVLIGCHDSIAPADPPTAQAAVVEQPTTNASPYQVIDLGTLPGGTKSIAYGINTQNVIAGFSDDASTYSRAVVWRNGAIQDLGLPFAMLAAEADDVNDADVVAGSATNFSRSTGWTWQSASAFTLFSWPGGASYGVVGDISNSGTVVGTFDDAATFRWHAFRYMPGTGAVDIHPAGYDESFAEAISDRDVIVGGARLGGTLHAVMWSSSGVFTDLGLTYPNESYAEGINSAGVIVGYARVGLPGYPTTWSSGAGMKVYPITGWGHAISDKLRAVGCWQVGPGQSCAATKQRGMSSDSLPTLAGYSTSIPEALNRCGRIVGYGRFGVTTTTRATLWMKPACD